MNEVIEAIQWDGADHPRGDTKAKLQCVVLWRSSCPSRKLFIPQGCFQLLVLFIGKYQSYTSAPFSVSELSQRAGILGNLLLRPVF